MNTRHYIRKTGARTLVAVLCLMALCGCSDSFIYDGGGTSASGGKSYMTLTLSMTNATRSTTGEPNEGYGTSSSGTESAEATESSVSSVLIVFTTAAADLTSTDPYPILDAYSSSDIKTSASDGTYEVTIELPSDAQLSSATNMFVFCNPTEAQVASATGLSTTWTAKDTYELSSAGDSEDTTPWTSNGMFMSSAVLNTVTFPSNMSGYNESNPYDLGTVRVERSIARFDYKDGAPDPENAPFTYTILSHEVDGVAVPQINVELQEIALFDMSKEFYHLRQGYAGTGDNSASSASSSPLLTETSTSWVCDPNYSAKEAATYQEDEYSISDLFVSPLSKPSTWEFTKLSELTTDGGADDYKFWRYATENCPTSASNQRRGNTTGVVFKGEIMAPEGSEHNFDGTSRIYHFEQYLYDSWEDVAKAATAEDAADEHPDLVEAYEKVMETWTNEKNETDEDVVQAMADAGFTGYAPELGDDGQYHYYVYYYYWNRHNDNGDNEDMGTMEFAVVRNNVYGLSVIAINELGHPQPYDDDYDDYSGVAPNSLTRADGIHFHHVPDAYPIVLLEPCEEVTFITVGLQILPWIADNEADVSFSVNTSDEYTYQIEIGE